MKNQIIRKKSEARMAIGAHLLIPLIPVFAGVALLMYSCNSRFEWSGNPTDSQIEICVNSFPIEKEEKDFTILEKKLFVDHAFLTYADLDKNGHTTENEIFGVRHNYDLNKKFESYLETCIETRKGLREYDEHIKNNSEYSNGFMEEYTLEKIKRDNQVKIKK